MAEGVLAGLCGAGWAHSTQPVRSSQPLSCMSCIMPSGKVLNSVYREIALLPASQKVFLLEELQRFK